MFHVHPGWFVAVAYDCIYITL